MSLDDVPREKFPRHIAIIMDGNGRWAVRRGLERVCGHQEGARTVRDIVTECARLRKHHGGPDFLTLYSFSIENWKRPINEVTFLMTMYIEYLQKERATMMENNIRFRQIGRLDNLPEPVLDEVNRTLEETKNYDVLSLVLALSYGSRAPASGDQDSKDYRQDEKSHQGVNLPDESDCSCRIRSSDHRLCSSPSRKSMNATLPCDRLVSSQPRTLTVVPACLGKSRTSTNSISSCIQ